MCVAKPGNSHNRGAMAVEKDRKVIVHLPQKLSWLGAFSEKRWKRSLPCTLLWQFSFSSGKLFDVLVLLWLSFLWFWTACFCSHVMLTMCYYSKKNSVLFFKIHIISCRQHQTDLSWRFGPKTGPLSSFTSLHFVHFSHLLVSGTHFLGLNQLAYCIPFTCILCFRVLMS